MPDNSPEGIKEQTKFIEEVKTEIIALGDNSKANYDELRRNYEELKKLVSKTENLPIDTKERIDKLALDIITRQEALDVKMNERLDSVEVAMQRPGMGDAGSPNEEEKAAKTFFMSILAVKDKDGTRGAHFQAMKSMKVDVDAYRKYCDVFETLIRSPGDERSLTPEQFKALSVGVDPDGGYTVTPAISARIIKKLFEADPIRELAASETITTGAIEWMVDWGEAGVGWETETVVGNETTTPDFKKKRIPVHVEYARPRATQTLLEDSGINIENWLGDKVGSKFIRNEGAAFVNGDGIGKPRGFLTYATGTNYGQVEQVNMGAAAALTADGFIDVKYQLIEQYLSRCTWLLNRLTVAAAMKLKDGEGQYLWKPGMQSDEQATLIGLPYRMSTTMPVVAANALSIALADWNEAYMIVDRLGITIQRDPYTVKPFVEFYTRKRLGGDVVNYQAIKLGKIAA